MEKASIVSQKMVEDIKDDTLSLEETVVKETIGKTHKEEEIIIDQDPEIREMEKMKIVLDASAKFVSI